jgi:hypothetical protein
VRVTSRSHNGDPDECRPCQIEGSGPGGRIQEDIFTRRRQSIGPVPVYDSETESEPYRSAHATRHRSAHGGKRHDSLLSVVELDVAKLLELRAQAMNFAATSGGS